MAKTLYKKPTIKITYFTDPICSTCWIADTYIDKLIQEYKGIITLDIKMGGMLESWDRFEFQNKEVQKADYLCNLWDIESQKNGICLDSEIWKLNPISSSYPASIAFYAAKLQDEKKAYSFLYSLREMLFLRGKDISRKEILVTAAIDNELNVDEFLETIESGKAEELFKADLTIKSNWNITEFPTLIFFNNDNEFDKALLYSTESNFDLHYSNWEEIIERLTAGRAMKKIENLNARDVLKHRSRLSVRQICILTSKKQELIEKELKKLYSEGVVVREKIKDYDYWRYNDTTFRIKNNSLEGKTIGVIGGGMGGLYAGFSSKLAGISTTIYERRPDYDYNGFGFIILKNGINALDAIGLKNEVLKEGNSINRFKAIEPNGELILERYLEDCIAIRRKQMIEMLLSGKNHENLQFNKHFKALKKDGEHYKAEFGDAELIEDDIIIASDGINSKIRNQLFPESQLTSVIEREIVGLIHCDNVEFTDDQFIKIVDTVQGVYMGVLPLGKNEFIWFIQFNELLHQVNSTDFESLLAFTKTISQNYPADFQRIISCTKENELFYWTSKRMDLLPSFHDKNAVIIGDAAHPLLPFTSQGANSAIEDAATLMAILTNQCKSETLEMAFEDYYENRKISIQHYLKEGDLLLNDFVNLTLNKGFNLPLSIH
jgi:2-polyprenyl-6-methoxyphenol hydroxylase-like FAD-dependent oxidoreductase/predicted DsbA family dithiol-disulfide isomerase